MTRIKKITRFGTVYFEPVLSEDNPLYETFWRAALEEAQSVPPELPKMPPGRLIKEYDLRSKRCHLCNSSLRWFSTHCIQPECDNYAPAKGFKR